MCMEGLYPDTEPFYGRDLTMPDFDLGRNP